MNILQKMGISMPFDDGLDTIPDIKPYPVYRNGVILADRYEIIDHTNGSRGDVYHCHDKITDRSVAAKTIITKDRYDRRYLDAFMKEVSIRCALPLHPNVISFERIIEYEGYCYIISEWVESSI